MTAEDGREPGRQPFASARPVKSQAAFRTISEVADELDVAQHVLRFWESKFPQVRPLKRGGGRRYYRPEDIELLRQIRTLLYEQGYTIKGAQRLLRSRRSRPGEPAGPLSVAGLLPETRPQPASRPRASPPVGAARARLERLRDELTALRDLLRRALEP